MSLEETTDERPLRDIKTLSEQLAAKVLVLSASEGHIQAFDGTLASDFRVSSNQIMLCVLLT